MYIYWDPFGVCTYRCPIGVSTENVILECIQTDVLSGNDKTCKSEDKHANRSRYVNCGLVVRLSSEMQQPSCVKTSDVRFGSNMVHNGTNPVIFISNFRVFCLTEPKYIEIISEKH